MVQLENKVLREKKVILVQRDLLAPAGLLENRDQRVRMEVQALLVPRVQPELQGNRVRPVRMVPLVRLDLQDLQGQVESKETLVLLVQQAKTEPLVLPVQRDLQGQVESRE